MDSAYRGIKIDVQHHIVLRRDENVLSSKRARALETYIQFDNTNTNLEAFIDVNMAHDMTYVHVNDFKQDVQKVIIKYATVPTEGTMGTVAICFYFVEHGCATLFNTTVKIIRLHNLPK
jgi:hypothetical protein